ncbi:hypothetical protein B0A54_01756 [Friedmanniomyces endolithicus]|uniref:Uncharacterized protein n=1 Tax=Friedmanniomyces endolithicus TaxID=329885 RepID=A0A4U0VH01_9PEZI|nr:hypothetical protein B0A54_01756 [Friedmanniomyces endolithicus]
MASLARESSHRLKPTARPSLSTDDATQRVPIDPNDLELGPVVSDNAFSGPGDIVVPAHLLELVSGRDDWDPDPVRQRQTSNSRTDSRQNFDAVNIACDQHTAVRRGHARASSIAIGALQRSRAIGHDSRANPFAVAGSREGLRKTSLPIVREQESSSTLGSSSILSGSSATARRSWHTSKSGKSQGKRPDSDTYGALMPILDDPSGDTILFQKLSSYDLNGADKHRTFDKKSPLDGGSTKLASWHTKTRHISTSLANLYEQARTKGQTFQRKKWVQTLFEYMIYLILILFTYFVLVGMPLWKGAVWWLYWVVDHRFVAPGTWAITIGLAAIYAYAPLLMLFEKEPPMPPDLNAIDAMKTPGVHNTALLIPCYKSAKIIGPTLVAALKIFPPHHIYVLANGNSPTPLDDTEEICRPYGVNHIWSPVGSKIVAQFVGCYAAKHFENVLLIDDDCALPANFPIVSDRMKGKIQCVGYTIKSVGPNSSRGTLCQQAQDLEYKISGLQRQFAGVIGSATFPHGAISLWNTKFLIQTFHTHPGFSVSEDWFFGHVARELGCRITMCSAIFVETETPTDVFFAARGGSRGGFGEMTVFKQRFYRWNFFFVNGMYYNLKYIIGSWKLGFWEIGAKLFVWQEVYETLLYLLAPFVLPISLIVRPAFCGYLTAATFVLYYVNVTIFNEIHLRLRNERIGWVTLYVYYAPYKIALTCINIASCYWALYKYARYFAKKHPKIVDDERAVEVVFRLEEEPSTQPSRMPSLGRRMTVTAIGTRMNVTASLAAQEDAAAQELWTDAGVEAQDFGARFRF